MAISFQPDICVPGDRAGWGMWLTGHFREHEEMATKAFALSTPFVVPRYDIISWQYEEKFVEEWLVAHEQIHDALRKACNVTGINLADVDFSSNEEFLIWQQNNAIEHNSFRQFLGIK